MRKAWLILLSVVLIFSTANVASAAAAEKSKVKVYKNCAAMNKDYKGGVARSSTVKNKGGKTKYKPYVSKEIYDANKSRDGDKDGIACEK